MSKSMSMERAERFNTSEIAKVIVYGRSVEMVAKLKNVSATGALFELINGDYLPKSGDFVHIVIHLHALKKTHEIDGEVVWNEGMGFGIAFIKKDQLISRMMARTAA
jgi:hypothetical protein